MRTPVIVVAADGAPSGEHTVRWAAREAERRGAVLRITHVLDWNWNTSRYDFGGEQFKIARQIAETVTSGAAVTARNAAPGLEISELIPVGDPAARLMAAAEEANLLVIGSRGHGGFAELLLGSVSQRVATHAACPVAVIRGRDDVKDGPVAVGVDDADTSGQVLATAFEAAAARQTDLVAIRSYLPVLPLYRRGATPENVATPEQDDQERARLHERLDPWIAKYPEVRTEALLSHDSAAAVLTGVSHSAQLIVIGSRGHGVFAGTLLGSTGLQLLHHADCPVLLHRPHQPRR